MLHCASFAEVVSIALTSCISRTEGYADGLPVAERIVEKQPSPPAPALDEDAPETQATAVEQDTAPGQDEPKVTSAEKVADEELPGLGE